MVFLCIASIVWSSIALHGIALHRIAWHCMVLQRLHGVVQIIWRAGELPRSASSPTRRASGEASFHGKDRPKNYSSKNYFAS